MKPDIWDWHRRFIVIGILDMVCQGGHHDTKELVVWETVERRKRWHYPSNSSWWEYRWPA